MNCQFKINQNNALNELTMHKSHDIMNPQSKGKPQKGSDNSMSEEKKELIKDVTKRIENLSPNKQERVLGIMQGILLVHEEKVTDSCQPAE